MSDIIEKVETYFSTVGDGSRKTLLEVRPAIDALIDPKVVFVTPEGEIYYNQLLEHIGPLMAEGATAKLDACTLHPKGVEYQVKTTIPGREPMVVRSVATVENGKFVHVEPQMNGYVYNVLFGEPNTIARVERCLDMWDGTKTNIEEIQPALEASLDPSAVIVTPKGEISYEQYLQQCARLLVEGRKCERHYVKPHPRGVEFKYNILMPGKEPVTVTCVADVKDGKIVRVEPGENGYIYDELFWGPPLSIIDKLKHYCAAWDGKPKTLEEFQPTVDLLIDPKIVVIPPKGNKIYYNRVIELIRLCLDACRRCELQWCKETAVGVEYKVKNILPGQEPILQRCFTVVKNGRFVRLHIDRDIIAEASEDASADIITKAGRYFECWDGRKTMLEEIRPVMDACLDPNVVIVTPKGEIDYDQYIEHCTRLLAEGRKCELHYIRPHPRGAEYKYDILIPGKDRMTVKSVGVVENGKIVRVEPIENGYVYNEVFGDPMSNFVPKWERYVAAFDGTKKTLDEFQPMIDSVIDPKVVVVSPKGDIQYDQLVKGIEGLLEQGARCELQYCLPHPRGVKYQIRLFIPGKDAMIATTIGVVKNGKIVRIEPQVGGHLYNEVLGDPPSSLIVKKVETYFATLYDGKKKTLKESMPMIDSLMDDKVIFLSPKGEIPHDQLIQHISFLLAEGRKCELQYCKPHPKGVEYQVKILNPGKEPMVVTSVATVKNGKFVRVEPQVNGYIYNEVFGEPPQ